MTRTATRLFLVLGLLLLAAAPAVAQGQAPYTWRALYSGQLAGQQVTLDLTLADDGFAFARLLRAGSSEVLLGSGTHADDGTVDVYLLVQQRPLAPSPAIDYAHANFLTPSPEQEVGPEPELNLRATRSLEWTDDGATLTVELNDLSASASTVAGTLTRDAQYAFGSLVEGRIDVSYSYPRNLVGATALNALLERAALQRMAQWVGDGRDVVDSGNGLGWAWTHAETVDVMGAAAAYRSLLTSFFYYTGGAHPNSHSESLLVEVNGADVLLLGLEELFTTGSNWLERVSTAVLAGLEQQGADAVTNGELSQLTATDLATFTLGPAGLSFHFDPYAVGPYVQGSFVVTVPYADLADLAAPGGALEAFAAEY